MSLKRDDTAIAAHIAAISDSDVFGFQTSDLIYYMSFDAAVALDVLKDGVTREQFEGARTEANITDDPLDEARSYLAFAWEKANNQRGLSAMRSIEHFKAWLWLAGVDDVEARLSDYEFYGKDKLVEISVALGYDWEAADDGYWANNEGEDHQEVDKADMLARGEALKAVLGLP